MVELLEGDFEHAFSYFEEAAAIARRLGARRFGTEAIWGFSQVAAAGGDADRLSPGPEPVEIECQRHLAADHVPVQVDDEVAPRVDRPVAGSAASVRRASSITPRAPATPSTRP